MNLCTLLPEAVKYEKFLSLDLKVAIVGFGKMGILHSGILNMLKPGTIRTVVDRDRLLIAGAARVLRNIKFYRSLEKMLSLEQPDVVYVTTPTQTHYLILCTLLENDTKNIFVEKPPTLNSEQLADLVKRLSPSHITMVGLQKRYALPFRHAKLLLESRALGEVTSIKACIKSGDIRTPTSRFDLIGRGVLLDLGIHLIDLLEWMVGIKEISEVTARSIYTKVDDYVNAVLRTNRGAEARVEVTWSSPEHRIPETLIQIAGEDGTLMVTEDCLKVSLKNPNLLLQGQREARLCKPHYYQNTPPVNLADPEYTLENLHFLRCIHEREQPETSLPRTLKAMQVIDKMYEVAQRG